MKDHALRARLDQVEARALSWLAQHLGYFNPLKYTEMLKLDLAIKASAELALLCDYALGQRAGREADYEQLASFLWSEVFCANEVRDYLLTAELGLLTFNFYASLRQCGYRDEDYERRLRALLDEGYVLASERIPTRDLDFIHSLQKLGFEYSREDASQTYAKSLLSRHPSLYPLTTDDIYAITHVIFFVTDFGRMPGGFSEGDVGYLSASLPRLLRYYLRKHNWDLVAELIICLQAVGLSRVPEYDHALGLLLSAQADDGSFPGPIGDEGGRLWGEAKEVAKSATDSWQRFHDNYHTTLVSIIAARAARTIPSID
jgi:hypothetical protein